MDMADPKQQPQPQRRERQEPPAQQPGDRSRQDKRERHEPQRREPDPDDQRYAPRENFPER